MSWVNLAEGVLWAFADASRMSRGDHLAPDLLLTYEETQAIRRASFSALWDHPWGLAAILTHAEWERVRASDPELHRSDLEDRRRDYDFHRRAHTVVYQAQLAAARERSAARRQDAASRQRFNAERSAAHASARQARIAERQCANEKCTNAVPDRRGSGPVPIYCSVKCNRQVASRSYWRRRHQRRRSGG